MPDPKIVIIPLPEPKSSQHIIEILKGWIEKAQTQKVTYIAIEGVVDGKQQAVSFACRYEDPSKPI